MTGALSTRSCGPLCARTCGGKFVDETPCGGCTDPRISFSHVLADGAGTGATRSRHRRRDGSTEIGVPSRRGQPHRLRVSTQRSFRAGRAAIRRSTVRFAGQRSGGRGDTRGSCRLPGLPGAGRRPARGPSDSYSEGPRCVAGQGIPAYAEPRHQRIRPVRSTARAGVHRSLTSGAVPPPHASGRTSMALDTDTTSQSAWDRWFHLTARGSTTGRELRGGLVTFFTMAYIVVLNPLIIGTAKDVNEQFVGGTDSVVKAIAMVTAATALVRRRADDPHGRRRPLPDRDRRGPRAQRLRRVHPGAADDVGRRDGPRRRRGHHHRGCWCSPASARRCSTRCPSSSSTPSASASACSSRSSASSTPASRARARRSSRSASAARCAAGRRSSSSSACCSPRCSCAQEVTGAILIGIVATTVLAIVVEASRRSARASAPTAPSPTSSAGASTSRVADHASCRRRTSG